MKNNIVGYYWQMNKRERDRSELSVNKTCSSYIRSVGLGESQEDAALWCTLLVGPQLPEIEPGKLWPSCFRLHFFSLFTHLYMVALLLLQICCMKRGMASYIHRGCSCHPFTSRACLACLSVKLNGNELVSRSSGRRTTARGSHPRRLEPSDPRISI